MFEDADQMVCLTILSGILDTGFSVEVMISTMQAFTTTSTSFGTGEPNIHLMATRGFSPIAY